MRAKAPRPSGRVAGSWDPRSFKQGRQAIRKRTGKVRTPKRIGRGMRRVQPAFSGAKLFQEVLSAVNDKQFRHITVGMKTKLSKRKTCNTIFRRGWKPLAVTRSKNRRRKWYARNACSAWMLGKKTENDPWGRAYRTVVKRVNDGNNAPRE